MNVPIDALQRIGLTLFASERMPIRPRELVPVFHRWIQTGALPGQLLIDVANYEHVPDGPGVVLVAHEGLYSADLRGGHMSLVYARRAAQPGALEARLRGVARTLLDACQLLETDPALSGRLRFRGECLELFANDRLYAPSDGPTDAALRPAVNALLDVLYGDAAACAVERVERDARQRYTLRVTAPAPVSVADLRQRLGA